MDGIIIINKPVKMTSRDVVNILCKLLNTKKIGHTGTLDPIATGVLVVCVGKATKLVEVLTSLDKEYVASVKVGVETNTMDTDGKVVNSSPFRIYKERLEEVIQSFDGISYMQQVPAYSAVKINGRKLYEYARNNENVSLPSRRVSINHIELLSFNKDEYKFRVSVSKGTYVRSLIKDINGKAGIVGCMSALERTSQGKFKIEDSFSLSDIENNNYKMLSITDVLKDENSVEINDDMFKVIKNGSLISNVYDRDIVTFIHDGKVVAMYKKYDKDEKKMKPFKMFI